MARKDDDDTDQDDLDNESDDATGGDDDEDDEYEAPSKEDWESTRAALAKANKEAKKYRLALREAKKTGTTPPATGGGGDTAQDVAAARTAAAQEVEDRYRPQIMRTQVRAALTGAGLVDSSAAAIKRVAKMVDLDDLDLDDDGDVSGLDEAIADLKRSNPSLFRKKKAGGTVQTGSRTTTDGAAGKAKPASSASKLAAALKG